MKKEWAEKWVSALRSGLFEQGTAFLCSENEGHCVLGVLCEVAGAAKTPTTISAKHGRIYGYGDNEFNCLNLPDSVVKLTGMNSHNGFMERGFILSTLNDNGTPFSRLACIIEQNMDVL